MKCRHLLPLLFLCCVFDSNKVTAQLVFDNAFLQGKWLQCAIAPNGSWGNTVTVPTGYYTRLGASTFYTDPMTGTTATGDGMDFSFDQGYDGFTVGAIPWNGSYFLPGTPFNGWSIQIDDTMSSAFYSSSGFDTTLGGIFGGTVDEFHGPSCWSPNSASTGVWHGTVGLHRAGLRNALQVTQANEIDNLASWVNVTTKFVNTTDSVLKGVYYMATADPDNNEPLSSEFRTDNHIAYQGGPLDRHEVWGRALVDKKAFSGLATQDCRAKALIYQGWPPAMVTGNDLDKVYAGSGITTIGTMGSCYYTLGATTFSQDIAYGLVFNIGNIAPHDSAYITYAWIFSDTDAVDKLYNLTPQFSTLGKVYSPGQPDSVFGCVLSGCNTSGTTFDADILNGQYRDWSLTKWTWSPALGLSSTVGVHNTIDVSAIPGRIVYTITGTPQAAPATCRAPNKPITFTLYVQSCFTATCDTPCENDTLHLVGHGDSTGATYMWYGPGGYTSTGQFAFVDSASAADTGQYILVKTVGSFSDTAKTHALIRFLPRVTATSDTPCSQTTLHLKATYTTPVDSVLWTGPNAYTETIQNPTRASIPTTDSGWYRVVTSWQGCTDTDYARVMIDSTPEAPKGFSNSSGLPGESSICEGDTLLLYATDITPGVIFLWSGPGLFTATGANQVIAPAPTSSAGVYTITATFGKTCVATGTTNVKINPTPPLAATSNSPVCSGGVHQLNLQATSAPGATFSWTGPHTFSSNDQNPVRLPVLMDYAGIYEVTAFLNGCYATRLDTVVVNETPLAPWTKWLTFCQYYKPDPLQAMGSNILWYTENVDTMIGSKVPPIPNTDVVGETFFYATQTVKNCISALDSMKITVYPKPVVTVTPDAVAVCPHDTAVLKAVDTDPLAYYHWYPSTYLNDTSSATVVIHPETNIHYTLVASNMFGCTDTGKVAVIVKSGATLEIGDTATIYPGEKFQLSPETNCSSFTWFPSTGLDNAYISNPVASPQVSTRYIVRGINNSGCKAVDSIDIHVSKGSLLAMPNAFAPGTGPNNKFKVIIRGIATIKSFTIFDRWGAKVFETADINEGWDGTYKGVPQPFGVYIYTIDAVTSAGEPFVKQGNVTLIR